MAMPNTMIRPCRLMSWLNNSGCINCRPGLNSSARTARIIAPPMSSMTKENIRYMIPMSLWLVVWIQRRNP